MKKVMGVIGLLALLITVAAIPPSVAGQWTLSASQTDPYVNSSDPVHGGRTLFVWFVPDPADSMLAVDIGLTLHPLESHMDGLFAMGDAVVTGGIFPSGPHFGHYLLGVPECVTEPLLVARFDVLDIGVDVCIDAIVGACRTTCEGEDVGDATVGFSSSGAPPCSMSADGSCGSYPAVEATSWGTTKAHYR